MCCYKNLANIPYIGTCWLDKCPLPYVIIVGDEKLETEYTYNPSTKLFIVRCKDDYDSLVHKVKAGITCIMKEFNPDYIIKCDDDVFFLDANKIQEYANLMIENKITYHGKVSQLLKGEVITFGTDGKYKYKENIIPYLVSENIDYAEGPIYFLSKEACQIIIDNMVPEYCRFEDVCVGYTLLCKNILPNTDEKFKRYRFSYEQREFLNGNFMCWHDRDHLTFKNELVKQKRTEKNEIYANGTEKWVVPYIMGGLGNQMFTIVAAYITSVTNDLPLNIYNFTNSPHSKINYMETIYRNFPGIKTEPFKDEINYKIIRQQVAEGTKDERIFQCWNPHTNALRCILVGYFQYYRNIIPYEKPIRNLFLCGLSEERDKLLTKYNFINTGFIHVRRGDYLKFPDIHYLQPITYYEKALEKHDSSLKFFVVGDDNQWIKSQKFFANERFTIFEGDELETLALMSLCTSGAICANSSFSWWGAFLGTYEKRNPVVVPKKWIKFPNSENLIPEEWITISL